MLAICCCTWGLPLSVIFGPSENWLKKINFCFVDGYQLEIASDLRINDWVQSPLGKGFPPGLKPLWAQFLSPQSGLDCSVALVSFVAIDIYKFSASYSTNIPEPWGKIDRDNPFGIDVLRFITLCTLSSIDSCIYFIYYRKFLLRWLIHMPIHKYNRIFTLSFIILWFSLVFSFPLFSDL